MTDNDDSARLPRAFSASDLRKERSEERGNERGSAGRRASDRVTLTARNDQKAIHVAPTDPEVPSAKRRGAIRRQRSVVGLAIVVVGLLSITFSMLYRASQRVAAPIRSGALPRASMRGASGTARRPLQQAQRGTMTRFEVNPTPRENELDDDSPAETKSPNDNAPADSAAPPKAVPPATDIIRTPPF